MLHEPASSPSDDPIVVLQSNTTVDPSSKKFEIALDCIAEVATITQQVFPQWDDLPLEDRAIMIQGDVDYLLTVEAQLTVESNQAYATLDKLLKAHQLTPVFREQIANGKTTQVIHILDGRLTTPDIPSRIPNLVLLILTIASLLFIGTVTTVGEIRLTDPAFADTINQSLVANLWRGLPYTISIMLILGSHEMAHWLIMRKYNVAASLPYFIPSFIFSPFGTFGAIIITKGAIRNRKALFDIGVSGPLMGLVFAIPILLIGLATSPVVEATGGMVEGNSIIYAFAKILTFGKLLPDGVSDVMLNQLAWAGWTGLFVTALNLIPLGQLDGGHILYSVLGHRARKLYIPILAITLFLTLFVSSVWAILFILLLFMGRFYAVPLDDITPLGQRRQQIAIITLIIFALIFIPIPISTPDGGGGMLAGAVVITAWQIMRKFLGTRYTSCP